MYAFNWTEKFFNQEAQAFLDDVQVNTVYPEGLNHFFNQMYAKLAECVLQLINSDELEKYLKTNQLIHRGKKGQYLSLGPDNNTRFKQLLKNNRKNKIVFDMFKELFKDSPEKELLTSIEKNKEARNKFMEKIDFDRLNCDIFAFNMPSDLAVKNVLVKKGKSIQNVLFNICNQFDLNINNHNLYSSEDFLRQRSWKNRISISFKTKREPPH